MEALYITESNAEFIDIDPRVEIIAELLKTSTFNVSSSKRYLNKGALPLRIYHHDLADETIDYFTTGFLVNDSSFKPDIPGPCIVFFTEDNHIYEDEEFRNMGEIGKMFLINKLKAYFKNDNEHPVLIVDCGQ